MATLSPASPTDSQAQVIDLPLETRAIVIAGPGAGKTFTLLARVEALRSLPEVEVGRLLVLSFTRAVVDELRKRDLQRGAVTPVLAETFDSFASRILRTYSVNDSWRSETYDGRIEACTALIAEGLLDDYLESIQHVFLDEVQDLVGPRARFVRELMETFPGGFTAFGDPAQAIYDYADDGEGARSILSSPLGLGLADESISLKGNHRMLDPSRAKRTASLHSALIANASRAAPAVTAEFDQLPSVEQGALYPKDGETMAILCRSNVMALVVSDELWARGRSHRVRRSSSDRPVGGWVGALIGTSSSLSEGQCRERHERLVDVGFPGLPDPGTAWQLLCRADPSGRHRVVRASEISSRIAAGRVPWGFYEQAPAALVVSSVHSAKGLEFDDCVIAEWKTTQAEYQAEEARVRFVALTRARRNSYRTSPSDRQYGWRRVPEMHNRAIRSGTNGWETLGIEIAGDDVHAGDPLGGLILESIDANHAQERLISDIRPGDLVELRLLGEHSFGQRALPIYRIVHVPTSATIGVTSRTFGHDLAHRLIKQRGDGRYKKPTRIVNVRVADLETVAGLSANAEAAGLGSTTLWLRPRLIGLGEIRW